MTQVNHEAIFNIALKHTKVCLVDILNGDDLNVWDEPVLTTGIRHFVSFEEPTD